MLALLAQSVAAKSCGWALRHDLILSNTGAIVMVRASAKKPTEHRAKQSAGGLPKGRAGRTKVIPGDTKTGRVVCKARFEAVMRAAEQSGLLREKAAASAAG